MSYSSALHVYYVLLKSITCLLRHHINNSITFDLDRFYVMWNTPKSNAFDSGYPFIFTISSTVKHIRLGIPFCFQNIIQSRMRSTWDTFLFSKYPPKSNTFDSGYIFISQTTLQSQQILKYIIFMPFSIRILQNTCQSRTQKVCSMQEPFKKSF